MHNIPGRKRSGSTEQANGFKLACPAQLNFKAVKEYAPDGIRCDEGGLVAGHACSGTKPFRSLLFRHARMQHSLSLQKFGRRTKNFRTKVL